MVTKEGYFSNRGIPTARNPLVGEPKGLKARSLGQGDDIVGIDKVFFIFNLSEGTQKGGGSIGRSSGITVDCGARGFV